MRQGELFGLQWEDIDFARHLIHVGDRWHGTLGTPKSDARGVRSICRRRSSRPQQHRPPGGLSLSSAVTRPLVPTTSGTGSFGSARRASSAIRFHDLRHLHEPADRPRCSPEVIQTQLGHASIQTRSTATATSCPSCTSGGEARSAGVRSAGPPARRLSAVRRPAVGAKWEQSSFRRDGVEQNGSRVSRRVSD
jgi:hypothetical protein